MPLIKDGQPATDAFVHVADGEALPSEGPIIIGLARWQEERGLIEPRNTPIGLRLKPNDAVEQIAGDLDRRQEGERFLDAYRRLGQAPFKEKLYAAH